VSHEVATALSRIIDADLPPATERVALRLLDRAEWTPSGRGLLVLGWDDFSALCNRANRNAARRHLTTLVKAGLIHYSGSDVIYLTWLPTPAYAGAAPQEMSEYTTDGASTRHPPHTRADGGGGEIPSSPREEDHTTNHHDPDVDEWLRELGLRPRTVRIHRDLSADDIGRIIDEWERDVAAAHSNSPVGMGALLYRLKNGVTPVDLAEVKQRGKRKRYIPDAYAGTIIG
jgi:hypothetical protein